MIIRIDDMIDGVPLSEIIDTHLTPHMPKGARLKASFNGVVIKIECRAKMGFETVSIVEYFDPKWITEYGYLTAEAIKSKMVDALLQSLKDEGWMT